MKPAKPMPEGEQKPPVPPKPKDKIIDVHKVPSKEPGGPDRFEPFPPGTEVEDTGLYNERGEIVKKVPPGQKIDEKIP